MSRTTRRSRTVRASALLAAGLSTALVLSSCAQGATDEPRGDGTATETDAQTGGILTIFTSAEDMGFDPATSQSLSITSLGLTARRLTAWRTAPGQPAELIPDLATDTGTPSDDGQTWTFTLKDDLVFEDGTPITAQAVKFGLERSFAPELSGGLTYHKLLLEGGEDYSGPFGGEQLDSIETPDDQTLVFRLNRPYGDFDWVASTPAFAPVPEDAGDPDTYRQEPVASGPYGVDEYSSGNEIVLVRNENWDPSTDDARSGGPDEIVFQLAQDPSVVAQSLIADRSDTADSFSAGFVPVAQLAQAQNDPNVGDRLVTSGPGALEYLGLNNDSEVFEDVNVRRAIQYAVDKEAYRTAKGGEITGDFATTLITPGIPAREGYSLYSDDPAGDVDEANRLLEEAGVEDLSLRLVVTDENVAVAEAIQQGLSRADISVDILPLDAAAYAAEVTAGDGTGYDLVLSSWQPDIPSPVANLAPLFDTSQIGSGNYNLSRFSDPAVDEAIVEASSELDEEAANAQWAAIDQQILEQSPVVPLIYSRNSFLRGSNVENFGIGEFPAYPNYLVVTLGEEG